MCNNDNAAPADSASVPVFAPIVAPILRSIEPIKADRFLKEREQYEIEISAKKSEVPSLQTLPYTASIDRTLLKSLFFMRKFDNIAPAANKAKDLDKDSIETYIQYLVSRSYNAPFDPTVIESALKKFSMPNRKSMPMRVSRHTAQTSSSALKALDTEMFPNKTRRSPSAYFARVWNQKY